MEQIVITSESPSLAPEQRSFFFEALQFPLAKDKQFAQKILKWGLNETFTGATFRFNQKFQSVEPSAFFKDLFNNPNVRYLINLSYPVGDISHVEYETLAATQTTLDMFDRLEENHIVKGVYIQKMMAIEIEGIEIPDKVREMLLDESSENYCLYSEKERKQLLFKLFQLLVVGGSMNQYQDLIAPYLDWTRQLYKSLVNVRKNAQTNDIFVETNVYKVTKIDNFYEKKYNPQEVLYVIVNPNTRIVHVLFNKWVKFW